MYVKKRQKLKREGVREPVQTRKIFPANTEKTYILMHTGDQENLAGRLPPINGPRAQATASQRRKGTS